MTTSATITYPKDRRRMIEEFDKILACPARQENIRRGYEAMDKAAKDMETGDK